jgi:two-component system, LytTR family, response regulator AgrA
LLNVYICEDDKRQLDGLTAIVRTTIMMEEYDMNLKLATTNPLNLLSEVKKKKNSIGLYILDVDLNSTINGIELAAEIRKFDVSGTIIFVTTHEEMAYLTFTYKVEAIDYIIKDTPEKLRIDVSSCLKVANERQSHESFSEDIFTIKVGSRRKNFHYDDIIYFETSDTPHKIILHTENSMTEFYYPIKDLEKIDPRFIRCHKSYVVNNQKIESVDIKKRIANLINGDTCLVSVRAMSKLHHNRISK